MEPRQLGPYDSNMGENPTANRSNGSANELERAKLELRELMKRHPQIDLVGIARQWFPNGIPEVSGSYKHLLFLAKHSLDSTERETVINGDDIVNLQIALNTAKNLDDFLGMV